MAAFLLFFGRYLSERWLSACILFFFGSPRAYTPVLSTACGTGCANTLALGGLVFPIPLRFLGGLLCIL